MKQPKRQRQRVPSNSSNQTTAPSADATRRAPQYRHAYEQLAVYPSTTEGEPLPAELRERMEHAFATDFQGVRIKTFDSEAEHRGVAAFARGNTVHFAPRQFEPGTPVGAEVIAHELAHVVQQRGGRVDALDASLEAEAEHAAAQVSANLTPDVSRRAASHAPPTVLEASPVVQAIGVGPADRGNWFDVTTTDGQRVNAVLVNINGGGWYDFSTPGPGGMVPVKVRGASNIHAAVAAPAAPAAPVAPAPHPMDAMSRLQRAHERGENRMVDAPPLGTRVDAPTPLGMTGLSRQRFDPSEPQSTTRLADFPGTQPPGATYSGWVNGLPQPMWMPMVNALVTGQPPVGMTPQQERQAASIVGTVQYSEPYRFAGASKIGRSAATQVAEGNANPNEFLDLFPMAQGGGAHYYQGILDGTRAMTAEDRTVLEDMSDSSDGDEVDYYPNPQDLHQ
jgi:Domain of unknown function (DUF4157)